MTKEKQIVAKVRAVLNHIGETVVATNGQKMTLIAWRSKYDTDALFEDGTIVEHRQYGDFKKGKIANPNYFKGNKHIGKTVVANNGQKMTIVAYRSALDIDVQFEDGTVVEHREHNSFKKGKIANPNYTYAIRHIGETVVANNGQKMTLVAWRLYNDIDVQFEDGTVVERKDYSSFKKGEIANPNNTTANRRLGETVIANNGQKMTIVAYRSCMDIDIQFEDGTVVEHKTYGNFKNGKIANPNFL